jgi:hypothetical protein
VDRDYVTVLDAQVVADHAVDASASVVEVVVGQDDEDRVLSLLSLDQDGVSSEELQGFHGLVGESDDRVVVIFGIGDAVRVSGGAPPGSTTYISALGFFFFLKMAVAVSFSCFR